MSPLSTPSTDSSVDITWSMSSPTVATASTMLPPTSILSPPTVPAPTSTMSPTTSILPATTSLMPPTLSEPSHQFKLFYGVILALIVLIIIATIFVGVNYVIRKVLEMKNIRYVYETKPGKKRSGSHGSVYSVRSQGILELNPSNFQQCEHPGGVTEESNMRENVPQEQAVNDNSVCQNNNEDGCQQVERNHEDVIFHDENTEELGGFNCQSSLEQSIQSDSARNMHLIRQIDVTASTRSDSRIDQRSHSEESHHQPSPNSWKLTQMNTQANSECKLNRVDINELTEISDSRDGFENSLNRPLSIHEVHRYNQQDERKILISSHNKCIGPKSSSLEDIPGFNDPELHGDDSESMKGLYVNIPLDIYSSQILISPEEAVKQKQRVNCVHESHEPYIATETKKSTQSLDGIIFEPNIENWGTRDFDPCYNRVTTTKEGDSSQNESEIVYNKPILINTSKVDLCPEPMFDDPGYIRGFLHHTPHAELSATSLKGNASAGITFSIVGLPNGSKGNNHFYNIIEPLDDAATGSAASPKGGKGKNHFYNIIEPLEDAATGSAASLNGGKEKNHFYNIIEPLDDAATGSAASPKGSKRKNHFYNIIEPLEDAATGSAASPKSGKGKNHFYNIIEPLDNAATGSAASSNSNEEKNHFYNTIAPLDDATVMPFKIIPRREIIPYECVELMSPNLDSESSSKKSYEHSDQVTATRVEIKSQEREDARKYNSYVNVTRKHTEPLFNESSEHDSSDHVNAVKMKVEPDISDDTKRHNSYENIRTDVKSFSTSRQSSDHAKDLAAIKSDVSNDTDSIGESDETDIGTHAKSFSGSGKSQESSSKRVNTLQIIDESVASLDSERSKKENTNSRWPEYQTYRGV